MSEVVRFVCVILGTILGHILYDLIFKKKREIKRT